MIQSWRTSSPVRARWVHRSGVVCSRVGRVGLAGSRGCVLRAARRGRAGLAGSRGPHSTLRNHAGMYILRTCSPRLWLSRPCPSKPRKTGTSHLAFVPCRRSTTFGTSCLAATPTALGRWPSRRWSLCRWVGGCTPGCLSALFLLGGGVAELGQLGEVHCPRRGASSELCGTMRPAAFIHLTAMLLAWTPFLLQTGLPMTGLAVLAGEWRFKPEVSGPRVRLPAAA